MQNKVWIQKIKDKIFVPRVKGFNSNFDSHTFYWSNYEIFNLNFEFSNFEKIEIETNISWCQKCEKFYPPKWLCQSKKICCYLLQKKNISKKQNMSSQTLGHLNKCRITYLPYCCWTPSLVPPSFMNISHRGSKPFLSSSLWAVELAFIAIGLHSVFLIGLHSIN